MVGLKVLLYENKRNNLTNLKLKIIIYLYFKRNKYFLNYKQIFA